jgi:hypothetical protein
VTGTWRTPAGLHPVIIGCACALMLAVATVIPASAYSERTITVLFSLFAASYVVVGALVSARRPDNPMGRLMLVIGTLCSIAIVLGAYAGYALVARPARPLGEIAAWVTSWLFWPALAGVVLMVLIFPEGRASGRLRTWTARSCAAGAVAVSVGTALTPGPMDGFGDVANPLAVPEVASVLRVVTVASTAIVVGAFLVALGSVFSRRRRAVGAERGQLSWLAYATVLMVLAQGTNVPLFGLDDSLFGLLAVVVAIIAFPAAVAVAILRHRLYDIDRLISRSLTYGLLTATLVAAYLGLVLVLRVLLEPVAGASDLAVAASTLAVAGLFGPARRRIQQVVDRRFNRRKYDPTRTSESFSARLRHEVDLEAVRADLEAVVRATVEPTHVTLWVRGAP